MRFLKARFGLRFLFVVVTLVCVAAYWTSSNYRAAKEQLKAARHLESKGWRLWYVEPPVDNSCHAFGSYENIIPTMAPSPFSDPLRCLFRPPKVHGVSVEFPRFLHPDDLPPIGEDLARIGSIGKLQITNGTSAALSQVLRLDSLDELSLDGGSCDVSLFNQPGLPGNLAKISLGSVDFGGESQVVDLRAFSMLQSFEAHYPGGDFYVPGVPLEISFPRGMSSLILVGHVVTDKTLKCLAKLPQLSKLGITGEELPNDFLTRLASPKKLESLAVDCPTFADAGLKHIAKCENLRVLELRSRLATHVGFQHLAHLRLRWLKLQGIVVTDQILEQLASIDSLEELCFRKSFREGSGEETPVFPVTDKGIDHLCRLGNLRVLDASGFDVTEEQLRKIMRLPKLEAVYLHSCPRVQYKTVHELNRRYPNIYLELFAAAEDLQDSVLEE